MMIFNKDNYEYKYSPMPHTQNFIWVAEYYDGNYLCEYNLNDKKSNDYYSIDRTKLVKFGLIGMGSQMYFDVANGIFNINNNRIQVSYVVNKEEYPLTGRTFLYNDIIQYKEAYGDMRLSPTSTGGALKNNIASQSVGYKKSMFLVDANIHFKNILHIPQDKNVAPYLEIKISSDKDMDGQLVFRVNGMIANKVHAPLVKDKAGVYNWQLI